MSNFRPALYAWLRRMAEGLEYREPAEAVALRLAARHGVSESEARRVVGEWASGCAA